MVAAEGQVLEDMQFSFDYVFPKWPLGTLTYFQSCSVVGEFGTSRRSKAKAQFGGPLVPPRNRGEVCRDTGEWPRRRGVQEKGRPEAQKATALQRGSRLSADKYHDQYVWHSKDHQKSSYF